MALWRFLDYITEDDENLIADWYKVQDDEVRAEFDATLLILGALDDWTGSYTEEFKPLTDKHMGLGEIRFSVDALAPGAKRPHKRRFRPVGIWPPVGDHEFILILGCEKSGRTFMPHGAFDTALRYKVLFDQGKGTTREHN
jgi:hypothetical protein